MPPWDANSRKLAGTRAGKPMYIAFDVELMMQLGCRIFKTDEAILSPDWISNECIIAVYDSHQRDFYHFNRAYAAYRKEYNSKTSSQDPNAALYEDSHSEPFLSTALPPFLVLRTASRFFGHSRLFILRGACRFFLAATLIGLLLFWCNYRISIMFHTSH